MPPSGPADWGGAQADQRPSIPLQPAWPRRVTVCGNVEKATVDLILSH